MGRKAILDSDTASDDTIAILLSSRLFDLLGVTIVAGNVDYDSQVKNCLFSLEYFGCSDVPVFLGSKRPIMGQWRTVPEVHGKNGLGDWDYPEPKKIPEKEDAVDAILRLSREYDGELEVLAISPLTNLALAYLKDPSIATRVKKVWIMGGAFSRGNTTPFAEFNFWVDPEAAKIVLDAGFDVTIVPWEVTEEYGVIDTETWKKIETMGTKLSEFFVRANRTLRDFSISQGNPGSVHPDSLTVYLAYDNSSVIESRRLRVDIETCSKTRGGMIVDWYSKENANAEVVLKADGKKFRDALLSILSSF